MRDGDEARSDEAFWREQERRRQDLGQPCCTQSTMCWALADMPGQLAVVVHGEGDCLNSFFHHMGRSTASYYSTRLSDHDLVTGNTAPALRHLLELLAAERQPEAVLVLGTCPVEVIGDPFEAVVREVSAQTSVPMVALRTHGLSLTSLAQCQDWLYETLAGLPQEQEPLAASCNLLGLPQGALHPELVSMVGELGIAINGVYPNGTEARDWRRISHAETTFAVDRDMFPRLCAQLEGWGQRVIGVPLPLGMQQTEAFYRAIARAYEGERRIEAALASLRSEVQEAHRRTCKAARGRRLALCIRMIKTHRSDRLAFDGLGELPLMQELGFAVTIFVQGPPEQAAREQFAEQLRALGCEGVPFDVFSGPWELGERLEASGFELALMSDVARNVVERVGLQMIPAGALRPFFAGMPANLELIDRVLEAAS